MYVMKKYFPGFLFYFIFSRHEKGIAFRIGYVGGCS